MSVRAGGTGAADLSGAMPISCLGCDVSLLGDERLVRTTRLGDVRLIDADHAATKRPLRVVWDRLSELMTCYGSVSRGSGPNSFVSTDLFEEALERLLGFVGVSSQTFCVLVGRNTTDMLNRLARRLELASSDDLYVSDGEHSSN